MATSESIPQGVGMFSLRELPTAAGWKSGDTLAVFGEIFARGYINGLLDEARRHGMEIVRSTVGRREKDGTLRSLNEAELASCASASDGVTDRVINIPLEAGFDMEPAGEGVPSPVDQLASVKMSEWSNVALNWNWVSQSQKRARDEFRLRARAYIQALTEVQKHKPGKNLLIAHTMAGGVPRAKIIMPVMNRVFKGRGDRHIPSQALYSSDLGKLALLNFKEVTAETFRILLEEAAPLINLVSQSGGVVRFVAYGYHGTEILIRDRFRWQTYTPYFQGWAKLALEEIATRAAAAKVTASVYNCPEILTNSSSVFSGVEVPLYPLLAAYKRSLSSTSVTVEGRAHVERILQLAASKLQPSLSVDDLIRRAWDVLESPITEEHCQFDEWPQSSRQDQMELVLAASDELIAMQKSEKDLVTTLLSGEVFRACGIAMFQTSYAPPSPVIWLGHDLISQLAAKNAFEAVGAT